MRSGCYARSSKALSVEPGDRGGCQVNNLVLIRGISAGPGCGVIQSNGRPRRRTAARPGATASFPASAMAEPRHIGELARSGTSIR